MGDSENYSKDVNLIILFIIPQVLLLLPLVLICCVGFGPGICVVLPMAFGDDPSGCKSLLTSTYRSASTFVIINAINISVLGGIAYGVLSKRFSAGIIPGMPKVFNTPATAAFGIVAIASFGLTSLVSLTYFCWQHNSTKEIKRKVDKYLDGISDGFNEQSE